VRALKAVGIVKDIVPRREVRVEEAKKAAKKSAVSKAS
jgi:hypothetical protein